MTKDEALKLALEALETKGEHHPRVYQAITAIKKALAQPEQGPTLDCTRVACMGNNGCIGNCWNKDTALQQRTWVGLTEAQCGVLWKTNMTPFEYYQAIEAKLRSKNNV